MSDRVGLWLIGAKGGVASTVALGVVALRNGLTQTTGMVCERAEFNSLDLLGWENMVLGGHEIRSTGLMDELERFQQSSRALDAQLVERCRDELMQIDQRIRPGILHNSGRTIEKLACDSISRSTDTARQKVDQIKQDLQDFSQQNNLRTVVVVNLASTEPSVDTTRLPSSWALAETSLTQSDCPFPASALYAIAAFESGFAHVNFTPSVGSSCTAISELAQRRGLPHAGRDGKTGETLIKSALAPMFAMRNLQVMSWVGHNIFGNMDGQVLDDPINKATKVQSKDQLLGEILGYHPQSHISIEYIESLGDWKTAWDHIHFQGFLATPMTMQFTWQGCDSILAAPLVLDLFRLTERATRAGHIGVMGFLACFFKSPIGIREHNFVRQFDLLQDWVASLSG